MDDIKNLREEFDKLRKQNLECEEGCETEFDEEFPDYIVEITTKMLSPTRCGIYFSKKDIRAIGLECGEKIAPKQRQRMLTDVLKSVFTLEEMQKLFNSIENHIDIKLSYYDELSNAFPKSESFFKKRKDKAIKFKKTLQRILKDNKEAFLER